MRPERTVQASIFDRFAKHEIGRELKAMSAWLDEHRALLGLSRRTFAGTPSSRPGAAAGPRRRCCAARCSSSTAS